jgi:hypothetical protein
MSQSSNTRKESSPSAKRRLDFDGTTTSSKNSRKNNNDHDRPPQPLPSEGNEGGQQQQQLLVTPPINQFSLSNQITTISSHIVVNESTPRKRQKNNKNSKQVDSYFSPVSRQPFHSTTAVSSVVVDDDDDVVPGVVVAVVTPEKVVDPSSPAKDYKKKNAVKYIFNDDTDMKEAATEYVPTYIHKNLDYQRRGQASLSVTVQTIFQLVEEYYVIPNDFETNPFYGPLSGTCYEERVINAYNRGMLRSKRWEENTTTTTTDTTAATTTTTTTTTGIIDGIHICSHCAVIGHMRDDCPELI